MKSVIFLAVVLAIPAQAAEYASGAPPLTKVIAMLTKLESEVTGEGAAAEKLYEEKVAFCTKGIKDMEYDIKTGKAEVAELTASIGDLAAKITVANSEIDKISSDIAQVEAELASATKIRNTEKADFVKETSELKEDMAMLERAITVLERELSKGGSMLQLKNAKSLADALSAMVQASALSSMDASRLTALVQSSQQEDEAEAEADWGEIGGAPTVAAYKSKSGSIVEALEGMLEKAEAQLSEAEKKEKNAGHNFNMLHQSLSGEIDVSNKELSEVRTHLSESTRAKAEAESDLKVTSDGLKQDTADLSRMKRECASYKTNYETESEGRKEELEAIAKAIEVIKETMPKSALAQLRFLQLSESDISSRSDLINFEAVRLIRDLGQREHSPALTQLASKMILIIKMGRRSGDDPFIKVKDMIVDMIAKLEKEMSADDSLKEYCDKALKEATDKKAALEAQVESLSSVIESAVAKAAKLKEDIERLTKDLSEIASRIAEATKTRAEEKKAYVEDEAEASLALKGIKSALAILREVYSDQGKDAGKSIIEMLELCEEDFSKNLALMGVTEKQAAAKFDKMMKADAISKAVKEKELEYKRKEEMSLEKKVSDQQGDLDNVKDELAGATASFESVTKQCTFAPEPIEEKMAKRQAEIAGLKEALKILEQQTVLLQQQKKGGKRLLRGKH